jgi:hypothetical protein
MRKFFALISILVMSLTLNSPITSWAANPELELGSTIPAVIDNGMNEFSFVIKLPASVVLQSTDRISWNVTKYEAINSDGDKSERSNFTDSTQTFADPQLLQINSQTFGRQITYLVTPGLAGKYRLEITASVGTQSYTKIVSLNFASNSILSAIPTLVGISLDIDTPDPGNDQVSEFRAKVNSSSAAVEATSFKLSLVSYSGQQVDFDNYQSSGEWTTFQITAQNYIKQKPKLRLSWYANSQGPGGEYFYRDYPVTINFKNTTPVGGYGFKWGYGTAAKPVTTITLSEVQNPDLEIGISHLVDWATISSNVEKVEFKYQLQTNYSSGWLANGSGRENGYNTITLTNSRFTNGYSEPTSGEFEINPNCGDPSAYCNATIQYRIMEMASKKIVASFLVKIIPDKTKLRVTVSVPRQILFNALAKATVTTSPKVNGTCSFFRYSLGDIPLGSAKLKNGVSSLNFRAIWSSAGNSTASITARCSGSGRSGSSVTLYYGIRY